jgi:hypothetical protein
LIDTWGPAGLVLSQEAPGKATVLRILIRGGVIQRTYKRLWHWGLDADEQDPGLGGATVTESLRIGALVTTNPGCNLNERIGLHISHEFRTVLGTYSPFWLERQRQAGISAGQYVTVQFVDVMEKDPGRTLKKNKVENLYRILSSSSSDQLLPFLKSPYGVRVSFCSGLARRVEMRELFADLLPSWMQRQVPPPGSWVELRDTHTVLDTLRRGDLSRWITQLFQQDRQCYDFLCEAIVDITNHLSTTGVDQSGSNFVVAWVLSQGDIDNQCFKVPITRDNLWTRVLQDSSESATFAYMTLDCLQLRGQGCRNTRGSFPFQVRLVETEVHRYFDGSQPGHVKASQTQWALQHEQLYAIGAPQADATLQLCAQVDCPTQAHDPRLVIKSNRIPNSVWSRLPWRRPESGRLRERTTPVEHVQRVIIASTRG